MRPIVVLMVMTVAIAVGNQGAGASDIPSRRARADRLRQKIARVAADPAAASLPVREELSEEIEAHLRPLEREARARVDAPHTRPVMCQCPGMYRERGWP